MDYDNTTRKYARIQELIISQNNLYCTVGWRKGIVKLIDKEGGQFWIASYSGERRVTTPS